MAITEEAYINIQTYLKKNKELIIEVIKAKEKEASQPNSPLTQDEQILVSFANKRKNLFAALGMDFDTIKPTYYFVFITEGDTYKIAYLSTTDVAVNYAKLYYKYNSSLTITELNNDFAAVKSGIFSGSNAQKKNTNTYLYAEIANGIYFRKDMWSLKTGTPYFRTLLTMINNNNNNRKSKFSKDFIYEVII